MSEPIIRLVPWWRGRLYLVNIVDGIETKASCVVLDAFWTRKLTVYQFRGDPRQPWREWAARYFPHAPSVSFERMTEGGLIVKPSLKLKPLTFKQTYIAALWAFYRTCLRGPQ